MTGIWIPESPRGEGARGPRRGRVASSYDATLALMREMMTYEWFTFTSFHLLY